MLDPSELRRQCVIDDKEVDIEVVDTTSMEEFSGVLDSIMRPCDAFLLVYSTMDRASFMTVHQMDLKISQIKNWKRHPLALVGILGSEEHPAISTKGN